MHEHFEEMLSRLKLTEDQRNDAKTKYTNVAQLLHSEFYDTEFNGATKLLIGSYGKHTNIRPPGDVDLIFKIPLDIYEQYQDSPGALLQRIRKILSQHYATTDKISAWGKVVLVKFSDGKHDVELLPALEIDNVFMIPNTENGGAWESFDARADLDIVRNSNSATGGVTLPLVRIIKRWRKQAKTLTIKSYELEKYCADFLYDYDYGSASWSQLVTDFFAWLQGTVDSDTTQVETVVNRSAKARAYEDQGDFKKACDEWRKIFGNRTFPAYSTNLGKISKLAKQFVAPNEGYIEDMFPVRINPSYSLGIHSNVSGNGFRTHAVQDYLRRFPHFLKHMVLTFRATTNVPGSVRVFWKVRNFGDAARHNLRGEIMEGTGMTKRDENTRYRGTHYVECYIVKDGVCVAKTLQFVPIGED